MPAIATRPKCQHCGSVFILKDEDGRDYCFICGRTYRDFRDFGRMGGLQTSLRHGREHLVEIGRRGGLAGRLPTLAELRQQSVPQIQLKEERLPNRLTELKALWKLQIKSGELGSPAAPSPPKGG